jgi:hypothetical protein
MLSTSSLGHITKVGDRYLRKSPRKMPSAPSAWREAASTTLAQVCFPAQSFRSGQSAVGPKAAGQQCAKLWSFKAHSRFPQSRRSERPLAACFTGAFLRLALGRSDFLHRLECVCRDQSLTRGRPVCRAHCASYPRVELKLFLPVPSKIADHAAQPIRCRAFHDRICRVSLRGDTHDTRHSCPARTPCLNGIARGVLRGTRRL